MKYHDVSVQIRSDMHVYEGDPAVEIFPSSSISKGDNFNILRLSISTHTGTHIDAPLHFMAGGKTVEQIPFDLLMGAALVVDVDKADVITPEILQDQNLKGVKRILFRTRNSALWKHRNFQKEFVYISGEAAAYLVDAGTGLVGIDYLSVEKFGSADHVTHRTLLSAEVVVLEGLNLSEVTAGIYEMICLPLPVHNGDGAPCRVVLLET